MIGTRSPMKNHKGEHSVFARLSTNGMRPQTIGLHSLDLNRIALVVFSFGFMTS